MTRQILFEEVTDVSGINYVGISEGAAWGNFNDDSYPDLWVTNHFQKSGTLYLNLGDGTFTDITTEVFLQESDGDQHGAAWADFDNDGDQDLIQLVGAGRGVGSGPNQMYVNEEGILENRASELGIDYPLSRGRTPLWFDFDKDGLLDLSLAASPRPDGQAPPTIFRQTESGFEDVRSTTGFTLFASRFGFISDLTGDGNVDGVFRGGSSNIRIYDITDIPFEDVTTTLISDAIRASDLTSADFNGDLRPDLYLTRGGIESDLVQDDSDTARAKIVSQGDQKEVQFGSAEDVRFNLIFNSLPSLFPNIYIGASGINQNERTFTLSSEDPDVEGIFPHTPGVDRGIYIGYDSTQQRWQMLVSSPDKIDLSALINTSEPISNLTAVGFDPNPIPDDDQLLFNTDGGFIDQSQESGIDSIPIAGSSVASGDWDNDMDLDLYVVATGTAGNRPNILYENQGDGTFVAVPDAGGAEGTNLGIGDSVVTADYDLDGFLDLFVTNGSGTPNISQAPYQLFRNQGNDNNWLEIDLEGTTSNRDGIGAQVFVTAGGITQLREQSSGIHEVAQNHQRLHFGLADNTQVDEILVKWPNGQEQTINNVAANQLLQIVESSESFYGQPQYNPLEESGIFIWKEDREDSWNLRVTAGENLNRRYVGSIVSDSPAISVEEIGIESHDVVDISDPSRIDFDLRVSSGFQDGIDFSFSEGATLMLDVETPGSEATDLVRLGAEQWSVSELPLDLSDW